MICRFYGMGPPGSLFFVMAAAIGGYAPGALLELLLKVGLLTWGGAGLPDRFLLQPLYPAGRARGTCRRCAQAELRFRGPDSIVIGVFGRRAGGCASARQMERPYWVPVSCLAVIQGASLRAVGNRQLHRILAPRWACCCPGDIDPAAREMERRVDHDGAGLRYRERGGAPLRPRGHPSSRRSPSSPRLRPSPMVRPMRSSKRASTPCWAA